MKPTCLVLVVAVTPLMTQVAVAAPVTVTMRVDWTELSPLDYLSDTVAFWTLASRPGFVSTGYGTIADGGVTELNIPLAFSDGTADDFRTYGFFGVHHDIPDTGGMTFDTKSVFVAFVDGGSGAVGLPFETVFADFLSSHPGESESTIVDALQDPGSYTVLFGDFLLHVFDRADARGIVERPGNPGGGTALTLVHFGDGVAMGTVSVTAVPEPGTIGLLALGGLALLRRRRST